MVLNFEFKYDKSDAFGVCANGYYVKKLTATLFHNMLLLIYKHRTETFECKSRALTGLYEPTWPSAFETSSLNYEPITTAQHLRDKRSKNGLFTAILHLRHLIFNYKSAA